MEGLGERGKGEMKNERRKEWRERHKRMKEMEGWREKKMEKKRRKMSGKGDEGNERIRV